MLSKSEGGEWQSAATSPNGVRTRSNASWWLRGLLAIATVAVLVSGASFLPTPFSSPKTSARLTHTIARGELLVTVSEQGTLESSNNTEVKCKVRG